MLPVKLTRRQTLVLLGGAALFSCAPHAGASISIGSKNFSEELLLGEMYAQLLEGAGFPVTRKLDLGGTNIAMASILRGEIDCYPEYTGTALLAQLKLAPMHDREAVYRTVKRLYAERYGLVWLEPAPMNDTQALATTQATSARLGMRTLSDCARLASQLRLGAVPEFTDRPDGLPGLQRAYGGFHFAQVTLIDIGLKYKALLDNQVDVVVAFGTDGQIDADKLVVLEDDRHFFPPYQVAPVVRRDALARHPRIAGILDPLAPHLTDATMRRLNWRIDGGHEEPHDVAADFLASIGLAR
ncbi:MAG TPA: glycine betaine ABC transporter substrate-binding protein [Candidatus Acidoferrales bacterium]|nr:glycine betaine ABC transporter substrate-binding protein [Candidatus Acidoferrales bacterium]